MLRLSLLEEEDILEAIDLLKVLFLESKYASKMQFSFEDTYNSVIALKSLPLDEGYIAVLKDETGVKGVFAASKMQHMFNKSHWTAVELAFYILPECRNYTSLKQMIGSYMFWAKRSGCNTCLLGKLKEKNTVETYKVVKLWL